MEFSWSLWSSSPFLPPCSMKWEQQCKTNSGEKLLLLHLCPHVHLGRPLLLRGAPRSITRLLPSHTLLTFLPSRPPLPYRCAADASCSAAGKLGLSLITYDAASTVAAVTTNWPSVITGNG